MQEQLPRLDTLMEKRADDDAMYKARCRAMNDLVYQLEDENNLIGIKIAQTKRRIAEKEARIREAEERIAAAERGDISDDEEEEQEGEQEGNRVEGAVRAKKLGASSRKGTAISSKDKAGLGQSASQAQEAGSAGGAKRPDTAVPATTPAPPELDRPVPPAEIEDRKHKDQADEGVEAGEGAADPTRVTAAGPSAGSPRERQRPGVESEQVNERLERADAAVLQDGVEVESGKAGVERGDEMEID